MRHFVSKPYIRRKLATSDRSSNVKPPYNERMSFHCTAISSRYFSSFELSLYENLIVAFILRTPVGTLGPRALYFTRADRKIDVTSDKKKVFTQLPGLLFCPSWGPPRGFMQGPL